MQTLDPVQTTPSGALVSPAVARNTGPILEVLKSHLPANGRVLEVASGSGEHAIAFARALPGVVWTPSDPSAEARSSIAAWADQAGLENLRPAVALDAADPATWPTETFDVIVCINMIHISLWAAAEGLMAMAQQVLVRPGGLLLLYGPYREANVPIAASNAEFDASLKSRDPAWGLRDRDEVAAIAKRHDLHLTLRVERPANNICLLFRHV